MTLAFLHLLAQTPVQEVQKKTAAEEGKDIVLSMLVVGLVFLGVIALGELNDWRRRRSHQ
jgi:heme/copper-type cytochrome/quinol oxidase subunit 2